MFINAKNLLGLKTETESGDNLGKITDFDLDVRSHIIKSYHVESGFLGSKKLIIARSQVISISDEKMIVEDGTIKERIDEEKRAGIKPKAEPALSASIIKK